MDSITQTRGVNLPFKFILDRDSCRDRIVLSALLLVFFSLASFSLAEAQIVIDNRNIASDEVFSDAVSVLIGPNVVVEESASLAVHSPSIGITGRFSIASGGTFVTSSMPINTAIGQGLEIPIENPILEANYPNPFTSSTKIAYVLDEASNVKLEIVDLLGQKMVMLDSGPRSRGRHVLDWDGRTEAGEYLSSGTYILTISLEGRRDARRIVLAR